MADDGDWQNVDIPYKTVLVGFHAEARSGEPLSLSDDPREPIFVRTKDGDLWSADSILGFALKKEGTEIQDYAPPSLLTNEKVVVGISVTIDPTGTFHVKADTGKVDISKVITRVEFQRIKH